MLRGAQETLHRFRPTMLLELAPQPLEEHGGSIGELVGLLDAAGYALDDVTSGAALSRDGARLRVAIPHGGSRNVIARPQQSRPMPMRR
jgi:hypothetical protein